VPKNISPVFASLYSFAALADWRFGTLRNDYPDTAAFSGCCERGLPDSPYVQCHFDGESGRHSATRRSSGHSNWSISRSCQAQLICKSLGAKVLKKSRREPDESVFLVFSGVPACRWAMAVIHTSPNHCGYYR
jgi:hypothetical protein